MAAIEGRPWRCESTSPEEIFRNDVPGVLCPIVSESRWTAVTGNPELKPILARHAPTCALLRKWERWGGSIPVELLRRKDIREFLDWVYEQAVKGEGENPGRAANKAREHLRAIVTIRKRSQVLDFTGVTPRFRIVTYATGPGSRS